MRNAKVHRFQGGVTGKEHFVGSVPKVVLR